jgi:Holliday junction resolvase RusA-like endonuclease
MISIVIEGEPVGKARPRVYRNNGVTRAVTPDKTKRYEEQVKGAYLEQVGREVSFPEGPVRVTILMGFSIPKSTSKKKRLQMLQGKIRPQKKPDIDNVTKAVLDALNGLAYSDDKQVVDITASKWYTKKPFVWVTMEKTDE